MDEKERNLLQRIGSLIRGDWSGSVFDGRDVRDWINLVCEGKLDEAENIISIYEKEYN